jgi:hypothetical protein
MGTRQTITVLSDGTPGERHRDMLTVGKLYRVRKSKERGGGRVASLRSLSGDSILDLSLGDVFLVLKAGEKVPSSVFIGQGWHQVLVGNHIGWFPVYDVSEWEEVSSSF